MEVLGAGELKSTCVFYARNFTRTSCDQFSNFVATPEVDLLPILLFRFLLIS